MLGYSLDNLSLMALTLAIGFLVDDAIVFLENTVRLMETGHEAARGDSGERAGNQLHDSFDDDFARGRIFSAGIHVRPGGPHLPRIRGHHRRFDLRFGPGVADADSADVREAAESREATASNRTGSSGPSGAIEKRVLGVYGKSLWWFLRHRWISALTWVACMAGTVLLFMAVPKAFLPVGDSSFIWGVMIGKEGSSPDQMHALAGSGGGAHARGSRRRGDVHDDGKQPIPGVQSGTCCSRFLYPPQVRAPIQAVAGGLMGRLGTIPGVFPFLRPMPVLGNQHGRDESRTRGSMRTRFPE